MITSAAYKLDELNSYPLTPAISVIPAKAGIHCDGSPRLRPEAIYGIAYKSVNEAKYGHIQGAVHLPGGVI